MNETISLFIDESGKPDLTDAKYRHFILTGISISSSEFEIVSGYFSFIKKKYGLPEEFPFHTYNLLEDPSSPTKLSESQTVTFVKTMREFIETIPLGITIVSTDKMEFIRRYHLSTTMLKGPPENKERNRIIYKLSSLVMFEKFANLLESKDKLGTIHTDSRKYLDTEPLKSFLDIKEPILKGNKTNPVAVAAGRLCSIEFADKSALSAGLELADFVSFVAFARLQRKLRRFRLERVWRLIQTKLEGKDFIDLKEEMVKRYI